MARPVPFAKRFPGRHAVSAIVVLPSGSRVEIAGPCEADTALTLIALLQSDTTGERATELMFDLRTELARVAAEARARRALEDSESDASGSVDQNPPPVESAAADPARAKAGPDAQGSAGGGVEVEREEVARG